jgi:hypothetical protein
MSDDIGYYAVYQCMFGYIWEPDAHVDLIASIYRVID